MFRLLKNKKAQNTAEYAILIGVIIAVAIAMQTYVKRGVQARFKAEVDDMQVGTAELGTTQQYEPDYLSSNYTTTTTSETRKVSGTAQSPTRTLEPSTVTQTGNQELLYTGQ